MAAFLLKRFLHGIIVLWVVATLTFILLRLAPGGPFDRERRLPPEVMANIEAKFHLDESFFQQYLRYVAGMLRGDFGPSYKYLDRGVKEIIADSLPTSAILGGLAIAFALAISLPAGIITAYYRDTVIDRFCMFFATLGISVPHFIIGALLIWVVRSDFGPSYKYLDRGVKEIIADSLPTSAILGGLAIAFALAISLPAGIITAYYRDTVIDRFCMFFATLGISVPHFIIGALLIWVV